MTGLLIGQIIFSIVLASIFLFRPSVTVASAGRSWPSLDCAFSGSVHRRRDEHSRAALRADELLHFLPRDGSLWTEPLHR